MRPVLLLVVAFALALPAQMKMSVKQLREFIRSSIELRHDDKRVAAYVRKITMREQLNARMVEDLQGLGAGPRTVEALMALVESSRALPAAAAEAPAPPRPTLPPPTEADQKKIIEAAREYALNYTKSLPNFICTQVTRRFADPSGLEFWQRADIITAKLTFFEQKEDYRVILINNQPVDRPMEEIGGVTASGEFGTTLKYTFDPESRTRFEWVRWATLRGRRAHVFSFYIAKPDSKWHLTVEKTMDYVPAIRGLIYVDAQDGTIARLRQEADAVPPSFPAQDVVWELDYELVPIGDGQQFLLPLRFTTRSRSGKLLTKNETEYRMYRKFGAEATITFDTPEALPAEKFVEKPPQ